MSTKAVSLRAATTANSADIPENEHLWRSLTAAKRDLDQVPFERQREIAIWLWERNGFAARVGELMRDFTAGDEPHAKAEDDKLQAALDVFWDDPVNRLRKFGREIAEQLRIIGEQFITGHVRESDGRLRLGYLDPDMVEAVVAMPGNPRDLVEVHTKAPPGTPPRIFRIVRPGEKLKDVYADVGKLKLHPRDPELAKRRDLRGQFTKNTYDGIVFTAAVNRLSNATRGRSDLFAPADYLDGLDKVTFNATERSFILNQCGLDVTVEDASDTKDLKIHEDAAKSAWSKPGGVYTHNQKVQAKTVTADLKSADMESLVRIVKLAVLGGLGFPLAWFADPADSNRATLSEQGTPTARKLRSAQTDLRLFLRQITDFQIELKRVLAPEELSGVDEDAKYEIILPEIVAKDTTQQAAAMGQLINSYSMALMEGLITRTDAALLTQAAIAEIRGYEFSDLNAALLEQIRAEDERATSDEPELGLEKRPGDDGAEPGPEGELDGAGAEGDVDAVSSFNELTLAIQRLASIGDEALIDALRAELFRRLGMVKPDTLEKEEIVNPQGTDNEEEGSEEPEDEDEAEFGKQQEKPLPPAMAKQAEKMKRAAR